MKASELRIGNYINEFGIPRQAIPLDIVALSQIEQAGRICIDLSAIPLTEEWLLKFGFEKDGRSYIRGVHQELFSGLMKLAYNPVFKTWAFHIGTYKDITAARYVHQLQNLYFALTGEELTITE